MDIETALSHNKDARLAELEMQVQQLKEQNLKQAESLEAVGKVLHPDQVKRLTSTKTFNGPWSQEMLDKSIQAYAAMHSTGYNYCRNKILSPRLMPSKRTLQRQLAKIPCEAGLCTSFLQMMRNKVETMKPQEKLCILKVDEMSLMPKLEYDTTNQTYCGRITIPLGKTLIKERIKQYGKYDESKELATHAMSVFLGSLCGAYEQLIGFQFTGNSFCPETVANWLMKLTEKVTEIGLDVKGFCFDMSTQNLAV